MKKYTVETVKYEKDLETIASASRELETEDRLEALKEYRTIKGKATTGGVILSLIDEEPSSYEVVEEHNFERIKVLDEAYKEWIPENRAIVHQEKATKAFGDYVKRTRSWLAKEVEYADLYDAQDNYHDHLDEEKEWNGPNFTVIKPNSLDIGIYEFNVYQDEELVGVARTDNSEEALQMCEALDRGESPHGWGNGSGGDITLK